MTDRVNGFAVPTVLEVHVIAGSVTASTNPGDRLTLIDTLAFIDQVTTIMRVSGFSAATMIDYDDMPITALKA